MRGGGQGLGFDMCVAEMQIHQLGCKSNSQFFGFSSNYVKIIYVNHFTRWKTFIVIFSRTHAVENRYFRTFPSINFFSRSVIFTISVLVLFALYH